MVLRAAAARRVLVYRPNPLPDSSCAGATTRVCFAGYGMPLALEGDPDADSTLVNLRRVASRL